MQEIISWGDAFTNSLTNQPILLYNKAQQTNFKGKYIVRIPVQDSKGYFYLTKTDTGLRSVFVRAFAKTPNTLNGYVEFADFQNQTYKVVSYKNNKHDSIYVLNNWNILYDQLKNSNPIVSTIFVAQGPIGCPPPANSSSGGGFWNWLGGIFGSIGDFFDWLFGGSEYEESSGTAGNSGDLPIPSYPPPGYNFGGWSLSDLIGDDGSGTWNFLVGGGGSGGVYDPAYDPLPDANIIDTYDDSPINSNDNDNTPINFDSNNDPWPTINNVISTNQCVLYDHRNCLVLARAQIAKKGLLDLGSGDVYQTFKASTGYNSTAAKNGVDYIITKLKLGLPVIVGVDNIQGSPAGNPDQTTDHFVVIVGSGTDGNGNYFQFYDNASRNLSGAANPYNRLYYQPSTGIIGKSQTGYATQQGRHDYIVTQIRKSKSTIVND